MLLSCYDKLELTYGLVKWTGKAKLNAMMFGLWIAAIITAVMIPTQWYGHYVFNNRVEINNTWTQFMDQYRSVSYKAKVIATTDGTFSDSNTVDFEVRILSANITDLTHDYTHIKFLDAEKLTQDPSMRLSPSPDGGWVAKGKTTFHDSDRVWMMLSPDEPAGMVLDLHEDEAKYIMSQAKILNLGPASDTLALQFNSFAVKVAFIFGTFSILLLAPIFEAIFIPEKKCESNTNQNNPKDKSKQSKD